MLRKIFLIICMTMILSSLGACGKTDEESEMVVIGNGGNQINIDSVNSPGGEVNNEETSIEIGKEKSETIDIIIDWNKIIIDDNECSNIEEMKDQIVKSGCTKINLHHDDASKEAFDEVVDILKEIESTLEIDIDYN